MFKQILFLAIAALFATLLAVPTETFAQSRGQGESCNSNRQCASGLQCADGRKCAPIDGTGFGHPSSVGLSDYCHHDNHCASGSCNCEKGWFGFCRNWEAWPTGKFSTSPREASNIGFCNSRNGMGESCTKTSECNPGLQCANGQRCAPPDGTGRSASAGRPGDYCHHDNHCTSGSCRCPGGNAGKSFGFCRNWENVTPRTALAFNSTRIGFMCN